MWSRKYEKVTLKYGDRDRSIDRFERMELLQQRRGARSMDYLRIA